MEDKRLGLEQILNAKSKTELVNLLFKQSEQIVQLNKKIKELEEKCMANEVNYSEHMRKTSKIGEYYSKKERGIRRTDFSNEEVIERYKSGDSAYKISKDTGVGVMTIISRLKRAGVYEGKEHYVNHNKVR